jgi:NCS1 family nucleobase:cation symporter-1
MSTVTTTSYADKVLTIEPYGIEAIPLQERHGNASQVFTFWFSANLNVLTWFTGTLGILLGLSFIETVGAIILGNVFGTLFLAITSSQGPRHGLPQIAASGQVFGTLGLKLFGPINWLSNVGWFAVDIVLGVVALQKILNISYLTGLLLLGTLTIVVAVIGHNFIHRFAQIMTFVLGALFLVMSFRIVPQLSAISLWAPSQLTSAERFPLMALVAAAVFAYQIAFCTVSSDYSRYLYPSTSPKKIAVLTFLGSALAGIWLEVLGAAVTSLSPQADPIALIVQLMGLLAIPSMLTIALSTIPINVLAIYSGGMSLLAAGIPLRRWVSALLTGGLGILLISSGSGAFADTYKNFLLLLSYWITPWLGILLSSRALSKHPVAITPRQSMIIYILALLLSIPFMASTLYTGFLAKSLLGGADASYLVGLVVSVLGVRWLGHRNLKY